MAKLDSNTKINIDHTFIHSVVFDKPLTWRQSYLPSISRNKCIRSSSRTHTRIGVTLTDVLALCSRSDIIPTRNEKNKACKSINTSSHTNMVHQHGALCLSQKFIDRSREEKSHFG